jgi:hypothetical protein
MDAFPKKQGGPAKHRRVEPEIEWKYQPRIAPGEYPGYTRTASIYRDGQFKRWVCAVQVDVLRSDLTTLLARLTWFLNLGKGEKPHATRRKNYWLEWVRANNAPPTRKDRLSPNVFTKRYASVVVADTTKTFKQASVTAEGAYSVIRGVVRWESGRGER